MTRRKSYISPSFPSSPLSPPLLLRFWIHSWNCFCSNTHMNTHMNTHLNPAGARYHNGSQTGYGYGLCHESESGLSQLHWTGLDMAMADSRGLSRRCGFMNTPMNTYMNTYMNFLHESNHEYTPEYIHEYIHGLQCRHVIEWMSTWSLPISQACSISQLQDCWQLAAGFGAVAVAVCECGLMISCMPLGLQSENPIDCREAVTDLAMISIFGSRARLWRMKQWQKWRHDLCIHVWIHVWIHG
jgi:hypothetical protein